MDELLSHPAVQGGVAPFVAALAVAVVFRPLRLGALAALAAFLTCVYFVSGFQLTPLTATRKIFIAVSGAAAVGLAIDFAFKPTRFGWLLVAAAAGAAGLWVFWPLLSQKAASHAWLFGLTVALGLAFLAGFAQQQLSGDGVRAGAAALALGIGVGIASIFSASASYGLFGIAIGAGAGGFLLPQMIRGKKALAGATFTLTAMVAGGLVGSGAMLLAQLPWHSFLVLALIPVAARLPGPKTAPVWLQAVLFSLYSFVIAAVACVLAWPSSQN
jgi:hypothetical protein